MTTTFSAVYQDGVLRPEAPVEFAEGERVTMTVVRKGGVIPCRATPEEVYQNILAIAALYEPHPDEEPFSGEDHDKVLYGENGAA